MKQAFLLLALSLVSTHAFAAAPVLQWLNANPDLPLYDVGRVHQVLDADGNLYVASRTSSSADGDMALAKYDPAGTLLWQQHFDSGANFYDEPVGVGLDAVGSVYMAGYGAYPRDFTAVKYSPAGDLLWSRGYAGPNDSDDIPATMAVDASGNVYLGGTGQFTTPFSRLEGALIVSWNSQGDLQLANQYMEYSRCESIVVDHQDRPFYAIRYPWSDTVSINGALITGWGPIVQHVDADNNLLAAFIRDTNSVLVKFDDNGNLLWLREQPLGNSSQFTIRSDIRGAVTLMESHHQDDGAFTRLWNYSADGALRWSTTIPDAFASLEALAITRRGDITLAAIYPIAPAWTSRIVGIDARGRMRWNIPAASNQVVAALTVDARGNFYTSGHGLVARYSVRK